MHVSLAAESIFEIGGIAITNALFTAVLIFFAIIFLSIFIKPRLSFEKPPKWQLMLEMLVELLFGLIRDILGEKKGKMLFAFLFNFFVIILISNWFGLLPFVPSIVVNKEDRVVETINNEAGIVSTVHAEDAVNDVETAVDEIGVSESEHEADSEITFANCIENKDCYLTINGIERIHESAHLFRAPSSDLSFTVALAIISIVVTNFLGFKYLKLGFAKRYIDISNPIKFLVGIIELFSEASKVISFSFRLFGNIFAGEMLLLVITTITLGIATLPFYALEIFVGVIQAFVFLMLTAVFISVAVNTEH